MEKLTLKATFNSAKKSDLQLQIELLYERQRLMLRINHMIFRGEKEAFLALPGATETFWRQLHIPDDEQSIGFSTKALTQVTCQIRQLESRIHQLNNTTL